MQWCAGTSIRVFNARAAAWLNFLFFVCALPAQQFTFTSYGEGSGLTNLNATTLLQDHAGVVWAGTQNGLFTADGNRFEKNLEVARRGFESIREIREDGAGRIWVADGRRLGFWQDGTSQVLSGIKMRVMSHEGIDLLELPGQQDGVYLLRGGELFLISRVDGKTWQATPALTPELRARVPDLNVISSATAAGPAALWVGCGKALCMVDLQRQTADEYGEAAGVPEDQWSAVKVTRTGDLWARGGKNVMVASGVAKLFEKVQGLPADAFSNTRHPLLIEDQAGQVILNLTGGLAVGGRGGWRVFRPANGLPDDEIDTMMQDRSGALWLTTLGHGILRWRGYGDWEGWSKDSGLQSNIVWSVARDGGKNLWVASNTGLDRINLSKGVVEREGFTGQRLFSVVVDQRQHLWINDSTGRILEMDPLTRRPRVAASGFRRVFQMHVDREDRVWACTNKGLVFFSSGNGWKTAQLMQDPSGPSGYAWSIAEAADGTLWVDAEQGIFRLKGAQWTRMRMPFDEVNHENRMIAAARDGTLWIQNDLPFPILHVAVDGGSGRIMSKVDATQIASDNTTFMEVDRRGWVWVGSDDGVHIFNGQQWSLATAEDGLLWDDTDFHAFSEDPDGSVWIGTSAGVSHLLHPERVFEHGLPQVQLVDVDVSGRKIPEGAPAFDLRKPTLSFRFRNVNYDRGSSVVAQYRLDGEESDWHETSGTLIRYPALEPGTYDLRVRAFDQHLGRTSPESRIHFRVLEPWWKRAWALAVEGLAVVLLLVGIWRLSVSLLVARQRQLAHLVAVRTKELENEKKELLSIRSALLEIARRDSLTGLLNRSAIFDQLETLCQVSSPEMMPLAVVMADLDLFKKINDNHGHLAGDAVLRECARRILNITRDSDLVGRYGGEELLIVLVGLPAEFATAKIEAIRTEIASAAIMHDGTELYVTCSFGVAWFYGGESRVEDLLSLADGALYLAKRNGRNRVEYGLSPDYSVGGRGFVEEHNTKIQ